MNDNLFSKINNMAISHDFDTLTYGGIEQEKRDQQEGVETVQSERPRHYGMSWGG